MQSGISIILKYSIFPCLNSFETTTGSDSDPSSKGSDSMIYSISHIICKVFVGNGIAILVLLAEEKVSCVVDVQKPLTIFGNSVPGVHWVRKKPSA
jgi:hypothetical protein